MTLIAGCVIAILGLPVFYMIDWIDGLGVVITGVAVMHLELLSRLAAF